MKPPKLGLRAESRQPVALLRERDSLGVGLPSRAEQVVEVDGGAGWKNVVALAVDEPGIREGLHSVESVNQVADVFGKLKDRVPLLTGPNHQLQHLALEVLWDVGIFDGDLG